MEKFITVNGGEIITVEDISQKMDLRSSGNIILNIVIKSDSKSFKEISEIFNVPQITIIEYLSSDKADIKTEYTGYGKNFSCSYNNGKYYITIYRKNAEELLTEKNNSMIILNNKALVGLYELS